jgi:N-acetylmuramoyl-L-alanine amidase
MALFAIVTLASHPVLAVPLVSEMRVGDPQSLTRVALTLSQRVDFKAFTLPYPHRVVVDMSKVQWRPRSAGVLSGDGIIDGIRHGRNGSGTSRLVIDCRKPVSVRDISMQEVRSGTFRLIIDIAATPSAGSRNALAKAAVADSSTGTVPVTTTVVGGAAMMPVIGSTGLAVGDIGPSPPLPQRATAPIGIGAVLGAPKARPQAPPRIAIPTWVVAIDAGHGGQDPGAISLSGVFEKRITLATARALRDELKALGRYRVLLTRDRDVFIRLRDRIAIARAAGADLFLSLHADKVENPAVRGLSVYTLSERASDAEAAALADTENKADLLGGFKLKGQSPEVTDILIDLVQRDTMNQSAQMAAFLMRELREETLLLPRTHRFAGFAVLKSPDVPSALIELGYLSNPTDEQLLRSSDQRQRLARAIARAIDSYFVRFEARNRL